jgi:hypothetical protein
MINDAGKHGVKKTPIPPCGGAEDASLPQLRKSLIFGTTPSNFEHPPETEN